MGSSANLSDFRLYDVGNIGGAVDLCVLLMKRCSCHTMTVILIPASCWPVKWGLWGNIGYPDLCLSIRVVFVLHLNEEYTRGNFSKNTKNCFV